MQSARSAPTTAAPISAPLPAPTLEPTPSATAPRTLIPPLPLGLLTMSSFE
jgi:hypothetical protein